MVQVKSIIEAALNDRLDDMEAGMLIAWPNLSFKPVAGQTYYRPTMMPARTVQASLGSGGENRHSGLYQVDVFAPEGKGSMIATRKADDIENHFRLGTRLTREGLLIRVHQPPWSNVAVQEPGWYRVAVTIPYTCDVNNGELP